ncbi:2-phosphosulfolactate phosphatase [Caldanaerobius polysaccharolyticus]|uniref:2-phosphosulfolactate phosphatase n=1 Tax=Caldanaerobius polysaccharolyticus TaxID=44256 RepID=UPI00047DB5F7|nr:2-phosphosulfolactate phosphatase [Caldanaerobius polysaccharolyticus]
MRIDTYATLESATSRDFSDKIAVVIDTLRATSTIVTAINNGCKEVIPVSEVEEALSLAQKLDRDAYLLGGERNGVLIEGFDLSNSPLEYTHEVVADKTIILTTTNGTKAIKKASSAKEIIICSMLNVKAVARYLEGINADVIILCAGTEDKTTRKFSLEDIVTAGAVISRLPGAQLDDLSYASVLLYQGSSHDLHRLLRNCYHYNYLISIGYQRDVEFCLKEGVFDILPRYYNGTIKGRIYQKEADRGSC